MAGFRPRLLAAAAILLLSPQLVGCASYNEPRKGAVERGMASWYGKDFHGRATTSGEIYDMYGLTAAHRELPLGTVVDVKNLDNGRSVRVKVNDRGPFIRGRIIDLSYGAAKKLDMVAAGLARVEVRIAAVGDGPPGPSGILAYVVQVGAFRDRDYALELKSKLAGDYPQVEILSGEGWHKVRVGRFEKRDDADQLQRKLSRRGFKAVVVGLS